MSLLGDITVCKDCFHSPHDHTCSSCACSQVHTGAHPWDANRLPLCWDRHKSRVMHATLTGINQWDVDVPPRYMSNTNLGARVGNLNPRWNEDSSAERTDAQFQKAVQLTGSEFLESVDYLSKVGIPLQLLQPQEYAFPHILLSAQVPRAADAGPGCLLCLIQILWLGKASDSSSDALNTCAAAILKPSATLSTSAEEVMPCCRHGCRPGRMCGKL